MTAVYARIHPTKWTIQKMDTDYWLVMAPSAAADQLLLNPQRYFGAAADRTLLYQRRYFGAYVRQADALADLLAYFRKNGIQS